MQIFALHAKLPDWNCVSHAFQFILPIHCTVAAFNDAIQRGDITHWINNSIETVRPTSVMSVYWRNFRGTGMGSYIL